MIDERLMRLAEELISHPGYVSGGRPFPREVSVDDVVEIVRGLHEQMDAAAEARAEAARKMGRPLACGPGCTGCCEELVMIFSPEAILVARWLELPENAAAKQAFLDAYVRWKERVGDAPARLGEKFRSGDEPGHLALHEEQWRKRILCAFNQGGLCTIYPVRPLLCRNAHAVGTAAHCYGDDPTGQPSVRLRAKELDDFVENARGCVRAAHHAIGGKRLDQVSLCEAVHGLLMGDLSTSR